MAKNRQILSRFILVLLAILLLSGVVQALPFNSFTGTSGSIGIGNNYFDNENSIFNIPSNRNIYVVSEPTAIYIVEPISYALGQSSAYLLEAAHGSASSMRYGFIASDGYLYFVDNQGIKRRNSRNVKVGVYADDYPGTNTLLYASASITKISQYGNNIYFFEGTTLKYFPLDTLIVSTYTIGLSNSGQLEATSKGVFYRNDYVTHGATDYLYQNLMLYNGTINALVSGSWSTGGSSSYCCSSLFITPNYIYVNFNGNLASHEYVYFSNYSLYKTDFYLLGLSFGNNIINLGSFTSIAMYASSASAYDTFNFIEPSQFTYTNPPAPTEVLLYGTTRNATSGLPLGNVNVNITQSGNWYNTTSDSNGSYLKQGMTASASLTINASRTNFTHIPFSVIPPANGYYQVDLYLFPSNITQTNTAIQGMVESYPWNQGIASATVSIVNPINSSENFSTTSTSWGYYNQIVTNITNYTVSATVMGYTPSPNYTVNTTLNNWTIQNLILHPSYTLTVQARDIQTLGYLNSFTVALNGANATSTTTGQVVFYGLDYGLYSVTVSSTDYLGAVTTFVMSGNRLLTVDLIKQSTGSGSTVFKTLPHDVAWVVQDLTFNKKSGVAVTAQGYNTTTSSLGFLGDLLGLTGNQTILLNETMNGTTGTDGSIDFKMDGSIYYILTFIGNGVNKTWSGYPTSYQYIIWAPFSFTGSYSNGTVDQLSAINITVTTNITNSTSAKIYANYSDSLNQTSSLLFTLNQSIPGDPINQTHIQTISGGTNGSFNATFIVTNYKGQGYIVGVTAQHQTFGSFSYTYAVQFPNQTPLGNFNPISILMMVVGFIFFIAGMFGQTSTEQGSGIIVAFVWIFAGIGIFSNINLGTSFYLGLTLATVITIIMNINARARKEGIS